MGNFFHHAAGLGKSNLPVLCFALLCFALMKKKKPPPRNQIQQTIKKKGLFKTNR
jgi:hypothetical protein